MSNFVIDSREGALEAAQQYSDLGLPMPTDLVAYLSSQGIVFDGTCNDEELFNQYEQEKHG